MRLPFAAACAINLWLAAVSTGHVQMLATAFALIALGLLLTER